MKTTLKAIPSFLTAVLLIGCASSSQGSASSETTQQSETEIMSSESYTMDFTGKTRADFDRLKDMYTFYRGSDCVVFKDRVFDDDKFIISSFDKRTKTLASLYEFNPSMGSSEVAAEMLMTFYETVDKSERTSSYQNLYFDWANYGGVPIAYWTLTRGADNSFHQTADIVWFDEHVEKAFNAILD